MSVPERLGQPHKLVKLSYVFTKHVHVGWNNINTMKRRRAIMSVKIGDGKVWLVSVDFTNIGLIGLVILSSLFWFMEKQVFCARFQL